MSRTPFHPRAASRVLIGMLLAATPANATYSIVASDQATGQTGGAGTSCLGGGDVYIIYGALPGVGAVHAQATYNRAARDRAVELLSSGQTPESIVQTITAPSFDAEAASRQYAVVDVMGRVAGFTGSTARTFADDLQGQIGSFTYSVQGNILTGPNVLTRAAEAFKASGCDLADRLMRALEAGADDAEGDSRCTQSRGIPSDSAFLQVEQAGTLGGSYLSLRVPTSGTQNPLLELRTEFDAWRSTHACGTSGVGGRGGAASAGVGNGGAGIAGASIRAGLGGAAGTDAAEARSSGCDCRIGRPKTSPYGLAVLNAFGSWWALRRRKGGRRNGRC